MTERRPEGAAPPATPPAGSAAVPEVPASAVQLIKDCQDAVILRQAQVLLVRALASISATFGLALLFGGRVRFESTPSYTYAATVPGSWRTWGGAALVVGVYTLAASRFPPHRRMVMWGLLSQSVVFAFFAISIFVSAVRDPTTPFTGVVIYGGYSIICAIGYGVGHELRRAAPS